MPLRAGRIHCLPRLADWVASFSHGRVSTGTAGYSAVGTATASVAGRFSVSGGFEVMVDCDADTDYCSPADIGVTSNAVFSMQGTSTINTPFGIPVSGRVSINVTAAVWPDSPERQAAGYEQRRAQSARRHACAITHQARMREHSPSAVRSIALGAQVSHGRHARSEHVQPDARLPRQRGAYLCTRAATDWIPVLRNPRLVLGTGVSAPATSAWSSGGSSAAIGSNNLADYSGSCTSCLHTEPAWPGSGVSVQPGSGEWAVMTGLRRYPEYRGILTDGLYARADVVFSSSSNMGMMLSFIPRILGRPQSEITRRLSVGSEVFVPLSGSMNERLEASYIQATFAPLVGGNGFSPPSLISRVGEQVVK